MSKLAKNVSRDYVNTFVVGGAAWSLVPIPGHSLVLTAAEATMLANIAKVYGLRLQGAIGSLLFKAIMLKIGGSVLLKGLSEVLTFVPVVGWLAKPAVSAAAIKGFGEAAIAYLEDAFPNQQAYTKPSYSALVTIFGMQIAAYELQQYYNSYNIDNTNQVIQTPSTENHSHITLKCGRSGNFGASGQCFPCSNCSYSTSGYRCIC